MVPQVPQIRQVSQVSQVPQALLVPEVHGLLIHSLVTHADCVNTRSLYVVRGFRCHIFTRFGKLLGMNRAILKPRLIQPLGDF